MSFKLLTILQLSLLYWNFIGASSELSHSSSMENDGLCCEFDNYTDNYTINGNDAYGNLDFNSSDINNDYLSETTAIVTNLTVDDIYPDTLYISWTAAGVDVEKFSIRWFINNSMVDNTTWTAIEAINEQKFTYKITNLNACIEYKIIVTPVVDGSFESQQVFAKTAATQPGAPLILTADPCDLNGTLSLNISWQRPKVGGYCINKYVVSIATTVRHKSHFHTRNTSDTTIMMKHLYACTSYLVTVKAVDFKDVHGLSATIQSKPTPRKVTEKPKLINTQNLPPFIFNTTTMVFNWYVLDEKNNCTTESVITKCEYSRAIGYGYELKDGMAIRAIEGMETESVKLIMNDLSPYTHYICHGRIINEAGMSDSSAPLWAMTMEDAPSAPQNFKLVNDSIFTWEPPACMPGQLRQYKITFSWVPRYMVPDFCNVKRQYVVDNIDTNTYTWLDGDGFSNYTVDIAAYTNGGWSRTNASISFQSFARGVSDRVTYLECETEPQINDSNVLQTTLSWNLPCSLRGKLKHFEVFVFGTKNHLANHTIRDTVDVPSDYDRNERFSIVLGELRPQHRYKFHVSASIQEVNETGEIAIYETEYPAGIPPVPNKADMDLITLKPNKMTRTTTSIEVLLPLFNNTNGDIQFYAIIVSRLGVKYKRANKRFNLLDGDAWPNISSWKEAMEKDFEIPYQVTEPHWNPYPNYIINYGSVKAVKYVIGEDVTCHALTTDVPLFCNGPLKPDTSYQVWMRAFTNGGYADSDYILVITDKKVSIYVIIGAIVGILVSGIIGAVLLTKMSRIKSAKKANSEKERDLEKHRNRRQAVNSNPNGHESSARTRTRRHIDQPNEPH